MRNSSDNKGCMRVRMRSRCQEVDSVRNLKQSSRADLNRRAGGDTKVEGEETMENSSSREGACTMGSRQRGRCSHGHRVRCICRDEWLILLRLRLLRLICRARLQLLRQDRMRMCRRIVEMSGSF